MKKLTIFLLVAAMLASATACGKTADAAEANYIYGQIKSVSGNDVTVLLMDYHEDAEGDEEAAEENDGSSEHARPDRGNMPEGFDPSQFKDGERPEKGEMPKGFDPSQFQDGERPGKGEMPEGFDPSQFQDGERPEKGEMPEGFDPSKFKGGRSGSQDSAYTLTGDEETLRIPVGTTVTTSLGVETNFEVLAAGDIIKCSVSKNKDGEEIITAVWIMEQ